MVRIFGLSPRNISVKSRIGVLPEESYLYKYLNANETMDFYGRLFELSSNERKIRTEKLLKTSGLMPSRRRPVGEYSKGMARRIGLAQALINDPDLVIMDEPTSGLDPIGRQEVKQLVLELKKLGKTVLISSHLLADVEDVCDRIAILYAGKLIAEGNIKELLTKKDVTHVSVSGVPRSAVERVVSALRDESAKVDVSTPMGSLEEFFLSAIRNLESAERQKSPVEQVEIASADEKQSVIERLTTPEDD
jgi:ABC-2 type transport system ATP-binding protein